jgi:hypothetical protein
VVKGVILSVLMALPLFADSQLFTKVESLIGEDAFSKNNSYIKIIFSPERAYYKSNRLDVVKIVETLKENGLLKLFFKKPQEIELAFSTNGEALFFVKIIEDALQNMGYYKYLVEEAKRNNSEFLWKIKLKSEYVMDPTVLKKELAKRSSYLVDLERISPTSWHYEIDVSRARLVAHKVINNREVVLKRSQYAYWLDVSYSKKLYINSKNRNRWHPYIAVYDSRLRLLDLIKKDEKISRLNVTLPDGAVYVKIDDMYSMKNIKDGFGVRGK